MWVEIVRVGEVNQTVVETVRKGIIKYLGPIIENSTIGPTFNMPPAAYNPDRQQYDADLILNRLCHRIRGSHKVLALTERDLYTSSANLNFIFGLAQCPGRCAIVSVARLDPSFYRKRMNKKLLLERSVKEAVHELGHTFGLEHCPNQRCVMRFSNSVLEVDEKPASLCTECWRKLYTRVL